MSHLDIWTLYDNPSDYPGQAVARRFEVTSKGTCSTNDVVVADKMSQVKAMVQNRVRYVLTFLPRDPMDDPVIFGSLL